MRGNILQCYPVMLPWQVMLPSGDVIYLLPARAARRTVIKCDKIVANSFISAFLTESMQPKQIYHTFF